MQEPEESARIALSAARHLCDTQQYKEQSIRSSRDLEDAAAKILTGSELSMTMATLAFSETLVSVLGRSLVFISHTLMQCSMLEDKDEAYKDLFRRAAIDYLLEGTIDALKKTSRDAVLEVDKFFQKEG